MKTPPIAAGALLGFLVLVSPQRAFAQDDETPPAVVSHAASELVGSGAGNAQVLRVSILFNEALDENSVIDASQYTFAGASVDEAVLTPNLRKVILSVRSAPAPGSAYSLTLQGLTDLAGNVMDPVTLTGTTPDFYELDWAIGGVASQSSDQVNGEGVAWLAADGDTDGFYNNGSVTLNGFAEDAAWWEVDLGQTRPIGRVKVWFRTVTADECQALFNACGVRNDDFQIVILDGNGSEVFRRLYPGRPTGSVAYNLPPGVNGRVVRFEAQSPLTSSDGFFSLAELAVIAPYANATINVTEQPAPTTVTENRRAKFGSVAATVAGAPQDRMQIQWQVGGVGIDGANAASYTTPPVSLSENRSLYRAVFLLPGISVPSANAELTVEADVVPPTIQGVVSNTAYIYVTVTFSELVREATAANLSYYQLSGGLSIQEVTVINGSTVRLTTSPQTPGQTYTLTVNGVRDAAAGQGNLILPNSTKTFRAPASDQDRFVTIGNPGNPPDVDFSNGSGAQGTVNYIYQIGKYEVSNTEYAAFLNAKAKTDPNTLWDGGMKITREGDDSNYYTYTVQEGYEKSPVYFVAAVDAMRYANWINNGARDESDTESGTYQFTGYNVVGPRSSDADYFLPNEEEWYKAAYYDPTKNGTGGYWLYPTRTSDPNLLNYDTPPGNQHSLCFLSPSGGPPDVCPEDIFPLASSYYGTFNQAASVWEWNELRFPGQTRPRRSGGSWGNNSARVASSVRADNDIGNPGASVNQGFRIARVYRPRPEFVTIGNPGNPPDVDFSNGSGPQGSVSYEYQIGKYEVNNIDYAIFLNAKAKTDPNTLWDGGMKITREGDDSNYYTYTVQEGYEKSPVYFVAAVDAMRYANWINNGARDESDTESGTYQFTGYNVVGPRSSDADYFLPNEEEWYKAAYYDPTKNGTGGYWLYPTRTSDPNLLNYDTPPGNQHSLCFLSPSGGPPDVCPEDIFPLASSYYGTFNQAASVWEWNELRFPGQTRPRRSGGSWGNNSARVASSVRADNDIGNPGASVNQGFRLAQVTPPAALRITLEGNFVKIEWTGGGVLTSSNDLKGPWTAVDGVTGSPALVPLNLSASLFFRLEQ